ncbi:hypothetical protein [Nostoc sp.]|uniref:hypothetical protein n=1 Tax=Nostoc sp. TaxID=1180 RepID=UPI002FF77D72
MSDWRWKPSRSAGLTAYADSRNLKPTEVGKVSCGREFHETVGQSTLLLDPSPLKPWFGDAFPPCNKLPANS